MKQILVSVLAILFSSYALAEPSSRAEMVTGNGENDWIITEGATREGETFTFPEVVVSANSWLVMHPFEDGKPNGNIYVGNTYVAKGSNENVAITLTETVEAGDHFIVMLHRDVDEDQEFDFVFVDETHVEDRAVFEGNKMIAHVYVAP